MIVPDPGVLVPVRLAPAVAALLRTGWAESARRDGYRADRLPPELVALLEELDAVQHTVDRSSRDGDSPSPKAQARSHDRPR